MNYANNLLAFQEELVQMLNSPESELHEFAESCFHFHPWLSKSQVINWLLRLSAYKPVNYFSMGEISSNILPVVNMKDCSVYELFDIILESFVSFGKVQLLATEREDALWQAIKGILAKHDFILFDQQEAPKSEKMYIVKEHLAGDASSSYLKKIKHLLLPNKKSLAILSEMNDKSMKTLRSCMFNAYGTLAVNAKHILFPEKYTVEKCIDALLVDTNLIENTRYANHYEYLCALKSLGKNGKYFDSGQFLFSTNNEVSAKVGDYSFGQYNESNLTSFTSELIHQAAMVYFIDAEGNVHIKHKDFYPFCEVL
jgi:hypothetical protein